MNQETTNFQEISEKISFRKLNHDDILLLFKRLNQDFVKEFYGGKDTSFEVVKEKYEKRIPVDAPTTGYIFQIEGEDIGYIQTYLIINHKEYNEYVQTNEHSAGLDIFIGEEQYLHKGYGKYIITKFLKEIIFSNPNIHNCILGPSPENSIAIKAYTNIGFKYLKTIKISGEEKEEYLMRISREEIKM